MIAAELPGARVLFTARADGDLREDGPRTALEARIGRPLALGRQVHGARVGRVGDGPLEAADADGQATARDDVAVAVLVADCLPVAIAGEGAVAMVHAGWRGLAAGVLEEGVAAVRELGAAAPLAAVVGPGAGSCCYEVGDEVREALGVGGRTVDLAAVARERLLAAGVERVERAGGCTICDAEMFSFRREGEAAGRQAGVAWRG